MTLKLTKKRSTASRDRELSQAQIDMLSAALDEALSAGEHLAETMNRTNDALGVCVREMRLAREIVAASNRMAENGA
jgi:hypothetical protein